MVFENRRDAGRWLSDLLRPMAAERPIVIALPRGGVPVAVEVARALDAPLDLLTVRKLGAPQNPELGIGAVAEDGTAVVDTALARRVGVTQEDFDRILGVELRELRRRVERFRDGRPPLDVRGRTVILVDDGLATGLSDLAAVRALRERGAGRIVVAVPVGSRDAVAMLRRAADEVVCHTIPADLIGVGRWYRDFAQVTDDEVLALLAQAGVPTPPPAADPPEEPAGQMMIDAGRCTPERRPRAPPRRPWPRDLRPRQRQQPPQPAQSHGGAPARGCRVSRRCSSTSSPSRRRAAATWSSTSRCSRAGWRP